MPIEMVSTILGHASVETTKVYVTPSPEKLRDQMDAATSVPVDESPTWATASEEELVRLCGLR